MSGRAIHDLHTADRPDLPHDRREQKREPTSEPGILRFDDQRVGCTIVNLSAAGAGLLVQDSTKLPTEFVLRLERRAVQYDCEICWQSITKIGVRFISTRDVANNRPGTSLKA